MDSCCSMSAQRLPYRKFEENYTSTGPKQPFSHSHKLGFFDFKSCPCHKIWGRQSKTLLQTIINMDPSAMNLEGNQRETSIQICELESMTTQDPVKGRQRGTHIETSLEIVTKLDETGSSRRDTHGEKPGNHDETGSNTRETNLESMTKKDPVEGKQRETNLEIMTKQDPVEGRQRETNLEIMTKQDPVEGDKGEKERPTQKSR